MNMRIRGWCRNLHFPCTILPFLCDDGRVLSLSPESDEWHELRRQYNLLIALFPASHTSCVHKFINLLEKRTKNFRFSIVSICGLCDLPKFKINGRIYFIHCDVLRVLVCGRIFLEFQSVCWDSREFFFIFVFPKSPYMYFIRYLYMRYKWFIGCHITPNWMHLTASHTHTHKWIVAIHQRRATYTRLYTSPLSSPENTTQHVLHLWVCV